MNQPSDKGGSFYRKKPVVIRAFRFYPHITTEDLYQWARLTGHYISGLPVPFRFADGAIYIATLAGEMKASQGDWIIKGINGEFYPCKPDIFAATYEPVSAPSASAEPVAWVSETDLKAAKWGRCSNATLSARADTLAVVPLYRSPVAEVDAPSKASLRLLLNQVRRDWYRFTGYSQLKADIDHALDGPHSP